MLKIYDFKQNFEKFDSRMGSPLQFGSKINIAKSKKFLKNQNLCLSHEERRPQTHLCGDVERKKINK